MADPKRKTDTALRTPGPKKKLGLVVPPPLRMPHEELISTAHKPIEKQEDAMTSQTTMTSHSSLTSHSIFTNTQSENNPQPIDISPINSEANNQHSQNEASKTMPSQTSQASHSQTAKQVTSSKSPVAPERDFTRVANSIAREAVPAGVFRGKSKLLYDCLYRMTRGAVVPSRSVRISRPK